jgi:hypothetical protein
MRNEEKLECGSSNPPEAGRPEPREPKDRYEALDTTHVSPDDQKSSQHMTGFTGFTEPAPAIECSTEQRTRRMIRPHSPR